MVKTPARSSTPLARSQAALARALGVSGKTVSLWKRDPRWAFGAPPYDVERVSVWRRRYMAADPNELDAAISGGSDSDTYAQPRKLALVKTAQQIKYLVEKTAGAELDRLIKQGEYHKTADCTQSRLRQHELISKSLMKLPRALRQLLADTNDPDRCERLLHDALKNVLDYLAGAPASGGPHGDADHR